MRICALFASGVVLFGNVNGPGREFEKSGFGDCRQALPTSG